MTPSPTRIATTPRLVVRRVGSEDAPFLCELLNDPAWLRNIGDRGVRDSTAAAQYIQDKIVVSYGVFGFGMYLMEQRSSGVPIGLCGLVKREALPNPDLGFALLPAFRSGGYAFEAAAAVLDHAREVLDLSVVSAIVKDDNAPSIRLLERLGFRQEGRYSPPGAGEDLRLYMAPLKGTAAVSL
jgi:RimJ/RimL family protein N-acetyltransferase